MCTLDSTHLFAKDTYISSESSPIKLKMAQVIFSLYPHFPGSVILQVGDIVTFGHPYGAQLSTGVWKRQPDSEYQFIVSSILKVSKLC